jgi:hypothetical protein
VVWLLRFEGREGKDQVMEDEVVEVRAGLLRIVICD